MSLGVMNLFNHEWLNLDYSSDSLSKFGEDYISKNKQTNKQIKDQANILQGLVSLPRWSNIKFFSSVFSGYQHHHFGQLDSKALIHS